MTLSVTQPVRIGTGRSPLDGSCGKLSDGFTFPEDTETDPRLVVSPTDPNKLAIAFMRNPVLAISTAHTSDGGASWEESEPPGLSPCTGTDFNSYGDQDLAVLEDGTLLLVSVQGDFTPEGQPLKLGSEYWMNSQVVISRSEDFGLSWSDPVVISPLGEYQHTTLIASNGQVADRARVAWHVHKNPSQPKGTRSHLNDLSVYTSESNDGGKTWSTPQLVTSAAQALNLIEFSDGHSLISATQGSDIVSLQHIYTQRSPQGEDWTPASIFPLQSNTAVFQHPEKETVLAIDLPIAVGPDDRLYQVASTYDTQSNHGEMAVAISRNRGETWGVESRVARVRGPAWNASISVNEDGAIGVFWYDSRDDIAGDGAITTQARFAVSTDDGQTWTETAISEPFDFVKGPRPHVMLYLGNYFEVVPLPNNSFGVAFTVTYPISTGYSDLQFVKVSYAQ